MSKMGKLTRRYVLVATLAVSTFLGSGCTLVDGFLAVQYAYSLFWEVTPLIPVTAYMSEKVENAYWEEERYGKIPILDPVEGENAPLFCLDPPSPDEVMRALPEETSGGVYFLTETSRNNVRIVVEPIVDSIGDCRFYPMVGPARLHKCHYKCTVYYEKVKRSFWPIPFTASDQTQDVVYIDHDHLIRCAGPIVQQ